ncbi:MAG TPA: peptide deformylase [Candidatus Sulfotelmatobacter sp.]|jgi:peptide deformylase|nr:peptide deformylase [Candidatus Sulfotelmatobacter sp.]
MALLPILVAPAPCLKQKAAPVTQVDDELRRLMDDMLETMYEAPGIGLAAPQVGVSKRLLVIDIAKEGEPKAPMRVINPEIVWASDEDNVYEEGCLSVPEHYAEVTRPARVRVRYQDETGAKHEADFDGLMGTVIQHEMDHLDGILFVDHLSNLKRNMILRKLSKSRGK